MTDEERKHWDYIVKCNGDVPAIIAADAELTALRARVAQLDAVVEWACENVPAGENAYVAGIRRRAKKGTGRRGKR